MSTPFDVRRWASQAGIQTTGGFAVIAECVTMDELERFAHIAISSAAKSWQQADRIASELQDTCHKQAQRIAALEQAERQALEWIESQPEPRRLGAGACITALREALEAQEPWTPDDMAYRPGGLSQSAAVEQDAVACPVCEAVHTILDADESQIIRNAKDGYPEGRTPRVLTLQDRVTALCVYAADWHRWCVEAESKLALHLTQPARQPLTNNQIAEIYFDALGSQHPDAVARKMMTRFARSIEAAHGITESQQ